MDDLNDQIRRHYEGQSLSPDRAQSILAAGRAMAARRRARRGWTWLGVAAALTVAAITWWHASPSPVPSPIETPLDRPLTAPLVAGSVIQFFSQPDYQLAHVSPDRDRLLAWLRQQGAPSAKLPLPLADLQSYGCQVLEVSGTRVYVLCLLLDPPMPMPAPTAGAPGAMPMKKKLPLAHLVIAPRDRFAAAPAVGAPVQLSTDGTWHVATWARDDAVYFVVTTEPRERLEALVGTL